MSPLQKILVTGGTGFIGSHTVLQLLEQGYEPVIVDNFSNSHRDVVQFITEISGKQVVVEEGDCNDSVFLESLFQRHSFSGVIHFAAFKAVGESVREPLRYYDNNLNSLLRLLDVMLKFRVHHLVFSSSCTVYGEPKEARVDENASLGTPGSPYGWTKWMGEQILRDTMIAHPEMKIIFLRYFNPIGAHPSGKLGEFPQGVPNNLLPYITQTAIGLLPQLTIFGKDYPTRDGTCVRDFIHVMDLADAHIAALHYVEKTTEGPDTFNIGIGNGVSVLELIAAFERETGVKVNYRFGDRREGDVPEIFADAGRAETHLNWVAQRTINDAVRDAWKWEQNRMKQ